MARETRDPSFDHTTHTFGKGGSHLDICRIKNMLTLSLNGLLAMIVEMCVPSAQGALLTDLFVACSVCSSLSVLEVILMPPLMTSSIIIDTDVLHDCSC